MVNSVLVDAFNSDMFSQTTLAAAVNKVPYVPTRLGNLGMFDAEGISTTVAMIERVDGTVQLVPDTPRGSPPNEVGDDKRKVYPVKVPHFPTHAKLMADEVQNVRAFGGSELQAIEQKRDQKLQKMTRNLDATTEFGRVGAVRGIVHDSDGTTELLNLFTLFGVSQTSVDFLLGTTTTSILGKAMDVLNPMQDALAGLLQMSTRVLCGKTFWQRFITHADVKDAYKFYQKNTPQMDPLTQDMRYKGFDFAGMIWEQYRGNIGGVPFIPDAEAIAFPVMAPGSGVFVTAFAPADNLQAANSPGLPRYVSVELMKHGKGLDFEAQTNPLSFCTLPEVLIRLYTGN